MLNYWSRIALILFFRARATRPETKARITATTPKRALTMSIRPNPIGSTTENSIAMMSPMILSGPVLGIKPNRATNTQPAMISTPITITCHVNSSAI